MTVQELAFTAGLMEGEGSIGISAISERNNGALRVSMVNTNRELVDWMQERWPGYCRPASGLGPNRKPAWVWLIPARKAVAFLEQIEPYVLTQRMMDRIATAKRWQKCKAKPWQRRDEKDAEEAFTCYLWMAELNKRGLQN